MLDINLLSSELESVRSLGYEVSIYPEVLSLSKLTRKRSADDGLYDLYKKSQSDEEQELIVDCNIRIKSPLSSPDICEWIDTLKIIKDSIVRSNIDINNVKIKQEQGYLWIIFKLKAFKIINALSISNLCRQYNSLYVLSNRISISPEFDVEKGIVMYVKKCNVIVDIIDDTLNILSKDFIIINEKINIDKQLAHNNLLIAEIIPKNLFLY